MDAKRDTSREECERVVSSLTSGAELCSSVWELQDERVQSAVLIRALLDRAEKAEAELEASTRDGERINYLEQNPRHAQIVIDGTATDCVLYGISAAELVPLRAAIDAAIAQGRK